MRVQSDAVSFRVDHDGDVPMQNGNIDVSNPNVAVRIGADGDASIRRMNGDIAEIIACKGSISMSDLGSVDSYLKSKYNL